jgi:hypothetical protein
MQRLGELPDELLLHILRLVELKHILNIGGIDKHFSQLVRDDQFWKFHIRRQFPTIFIPTTFPYESISPYRDLYRHWRQKKTGSAKQITIPKRLYSKAGAWCDGTINLTCKRINTSAEILEHLIELNARRGDIIYLESYDVYHYADQEGFCEDYNEGKLIYDGSYVRSLDYTVDSESGSIPEEFQVIEEFPIHYWDNKFVHYPYLIYFHIDPYINEILLNMKMVKLKSGEFSKTFCLATFTHWTGYQYNVVMPLNKDIVHLFDVDIFEQLLRKNLFDLHYMSNKFLQENTTLGCDPNCTLYVAYSVEHNANGHSRIF